MPVQTDHNDCHDAYAADHGCDSDRNVLSVNHDAEDDGKHDKQNRNHGSGKIR